MKFIELTSFGGPDVLRLGNGPEPVAGEGEVLIRVSASGVNRPDVLQRKGLYPAPAGASPVLGLEVAGTVVSGDVSAMQVANIQIGDRVCALVNGGVCAVLRSPSRAVFAHSEWTLGCRGGFAARNTVYRLEQCV